MRTSQPADIPVSRDQGTPDGVSKANLWVLILNKQALFCRNSDLTGTDVDRVHAVQKSFATNFFSIDPDARLTV